MQEMIAENMLILARNMKEKSQLAGEIIKKDIEVHYVFVHKHSGAHRPPETLRGFICMAPYVIGGDGYEYYTRRSNKLKKYQQMDEHCLTKKPADIKRYYLLP